MSDYCPPLVDNTEAWKALDAIHTAVTGDLWGEIERATRDWEGDGCMQCNPVRIIGWHMRRIGDLIYRLTYDGNDEDRLSRNEIFAREVEELRQYADRLCETGLLGRAG